MAILGPLNVSNAIAAGTGAGADLAASRTGRLGIRSLQIEP